MDELEQLENEYANLLEHESAPIPLIRIPPGTKGSDGSNVGGLWIWGACAKPWMIAYHQRYRKELEQRIAALRAGRSQV